MKTTETTLELYDDHWRSKPFRLSRLRSELRSYVDACCDGAAQRAALSVIWTFGPVSTLARAKALVDRVNAAIEAGSNGLVVAVPQEEDES
jgi:hypothetical protein